MNVLYDNKNWLIPLMGFYKSEHFKKMIPYLFFLVLYSSVIVFALLHLLNYEDLTGISDLALKDVIGNILTMHSLLGFALSLVLVFRTNSAYDRWWEGRKLWGSLVNSSRNLAIKFNVMLPKEDAENRDYCRELLSLFAKELQIHLQKAWLPSNYPHPAPTIIQLSRNKHVPAQYADALMSRVQQWYRDGIISGEQLITLNAELQSLMDIVGACERIQNTPIPYSYSTFIKSFIALYTLSLPVGFAFSLGWMTLPTVLFIFYVLASLELIAEEIEDPFGIDANDLPLVEISKKIYDNVHEILLPARQ